MATKTAPKSTAVVNTKSSEQMLAEFQMMGNLVPETPAGDSLDIVAQIMGVESMADLDNAWNTAKETDKWDDILLQFDSVTRSPSDFADGLGIFLVVEATMVATGEAVTFATGSVSCVAQLVKAYSLSGFPFLGIIRKAERASRSGYFPKHIELQK